MSFEGVPRRLGLELEFAALSAQQVAVEIQRLFGGTIRQIDRHRFLIEDGKLGDFTSELDSQYVHRGDGPGSSIKLIDDIADTLREVFGDIGSLVIPCEVIAPPIEIGELGRLDELVLRLERAGARGTGANPFYAFGAHLNPEIATRDSGWILSVLKAEMLLSEWLRAITGIDFSRQLTQFAAPFPADYTEVVLDADYWPDEAGLIDDYLRFNPSRDREVDMLPLFAWLDSERVSRGLPSGIKVKARPTFHYRLPNAALGTPGWGPALEWNRWCLVEWLAEDREMLGLMGHAWRQNRQRLLPESWALRAAEWLAMRLAAAAGGNT